MPLPRSIASLLTYNYNNHAYFGQYTLKFGKAPILLK